MIPYAEIPELHIWGPITIQPFGTLILIGIFIGYRFVIYRSPVFGISADEITRAALYSFVTGILMSHWVSMFAYGVPEFDSRYPWVLVHFWRGMSSAGGFVGAVCGLLFFYFRKPAKTYSFFTIIDLLVQGLLFGFTIGRLGCTLMHDHPGIFSDFVFAVAYPNGSRHDLGLYEFVYLSLIVVPVVLRLHRMDPHLPPGSYLIAICTLYFPVRFALDFLRASDTRWFGF